MYTKDNPPEWATYVITFDGAHGPYYTFYNKERWMYVTSTGVDEGVWEDEGDLEDYLYRPVVNAAKVEEINVQLENE